ncbi:MAG TPA: SdrD B-like domain-containing protein, partial [Candidatus Nanoperiomorbaceae bacterium]|nr:SdrD B-like domain-containing protein [Candidatus Nanoperiomorbaceae bacterium]
DGSYEFNGLTPGDYIVEFETPTGFEATPSNQGGDDTTDSDADETTGQTGIINIESGETDNTNDAGYYRPASLGDFVWEDSDLDGIQDGGEPGIGGVTVNLLDGNGNPIATTTTQPDGSYEFTGLAPGNYIVVFETPTDYTITQQDQGADDTDSDIDQTGTTAVVTLSSGENDETIDAGYLTPVNLDMVKTFDSVVPNGDGTYTVSYTITVTNSGGSVGTYNLTDTPQFDNDVTILNGGVTFTDGIIGNGYAFLGDPGVITLASNTQIGGLSTHTYGIQLAVVLDLSGTMADGGDDVYTECGSSSGSNDGAPGEGLYNKAELDTNGNGSIDITDEACGDLPIIEMEKVLNSIIPLADGTYAVNYTITVTNTGGSDGTYSLTDTPQFDDDVTILSGGTTFTDGMTGNGSSFIGDASPFFFAVNKLIAAGGTHTYGIQLIVDLDLSGTINDGGDDLYTPCSTNTGGGIPTTGEGLLNIAEMDTNGDGTPDVVDDACGDLPVIDLELVKTVSDATPNVGDVVTFTIVVSNQGPDDATGVAFEDIVPNGYSAISNISNGGTLAGNVITWSGFDIAAGSSVTVTFDATIEAPLAGVDYVNVAQVTESDQYDPDSTPDNDDGDQSEDDEDNE